jgi:hypothetical protein
VVPTPLQPLIHSFDGDEHPDEVTNELAYVRPADAADRDPSRRARRASKEAVAYLSARLRRLKHQLRSDR